MLRSSRMALRLAQRSHTPFTRTKRFAHHTELPSRLLRPETVSFSNTTAVRSYSGRSEADIAIEEITELYATAQDEFEIAMEETEKSSVYAQDDREAARAELEKVKDAFKKIVEGDDRNLAEEVSKRVGQRIRELEQGVQRMEEIAQEHD